MDGKLGFRKDAAKGFILMRFLLLSALLFLTACSKNENSHRWMVEDSGKIKVLATTMMIGDLVSQIGKDRVDVEVLIQADIDPHSYELRKGDAEKFDRADLIFYNGLGLEHGASLASRLQTNKKAFAISEGMTDFVYFDQTVDPHIWMDLSLWVQTGILVERVLSDVQADGKSFFSKNLQEFQKNYLDEDGKIYQMMQKVPSQKRYLVTSHDAFHYFGRRYLATKEERDNGSWQNRVRAPEGLAPEGQVSLKDIQNMVAYLKKYGIRVVFPESNLSKASLKKIVDVCQKQGVDIILSNQALYGDTLGDKESGADSVSSMVHYNAKVMKSEWERS